MHPPALHMRVLASLPKSICLLLRSDRSPLCRVVGAAAAANNLDKSLVPLGATLFARPLVTSLHGCRSFATCDSGTVVHAIPLIVFLASRRNVLHAYSPVCGLGILLLLPWCG